MLVKDLIEWLQAQPQDAEVIIVNEWIYPLIPARLQVWDGTYTDDENKTHINPVLIG